jgi:Rod binding domain-containing protein
MVAPLASFAVSAAMGLAKGVIDQVGSSGQPKSLDAKTLDAKTLDSKLLDPKAKKAADDFETMFLEQMVDRLFSTAGEGGPLGEAGPGAGVYKSMLAKEYAGMIAKSGGVGLSDHVYGEILKLQEGGGRVG